MSTQLYADFIRRASFLIPDFGFLIPEKSELHVSPILPFKSDARNQKSEIWNQESEIWNDPANA